MIVSSHDNNIIEYGTARRETIDEWAYRSKLTTPSPYTSYRIMITATDATGQSVDKVIEVEESVSP